MKAFQSSTVSLPTVIEPGSCQAVRIEASLPKPVMRMTMTREEADLKQLAYEGKRAAWRKAHTARDAIAEDLSLWRGIGRELSLQRYAHLVLVCLGGASRISFGSKPKLLSRANGIQKWQNDVAPLLGDAMDGVAGIDLYRGWIVK